MESTIRSNFPELRSFLRNEAESYTGITVTFEKGNDPHFIIYRDGIEHERIDQLGTAYPTKVQLHHLVKSKGFQLVSQTENVREATYAAPTCGMESKNTINHNKRNIQDQVSLNHHEIRNTMEHEKQIRYLDYIQRKRQHVDSFRRIVVGISDDLYATIDISIPNGINNLLFLGNNYDRLFPMR